MSQKGDEPAFPVTQSTYPTGMSLRDWFAGMALAGRMASGDWNATNHYVENEVSVAYNIADAMLAEREKETVTERTEPC